MNATENREHSKNVIRCVKDFICFLGVCVMMLIAMLFVSIHVSHLTDVVWLSVFMASIAIPVIGLMALVLKHKKTLDPAHQIKEVGGDKT